MIRVTLAIASGVELLPELDDIATQLRAGIDLECDLFIAAENGGVVSITQRPTNLVERALGLLPDDVDGDMACQCSRFIPLLPGQGLRFQVEIFGDISDDQWRG